MLRAKKHKLFGSRVVHFWARIWSGWDNSLRAGTDIWDDGNTNNGNGCKTPGSNGETSNKYFLSSLLIKILFLIVKAYVDLNIYISFIQKVVSLLKLIFTVLLLKA